MTITDGAGELGVHLTIALAVVYIIQWAKATSLIPQLTADTDRLNRITSAVVAFIVALGIQYEFDPDAGTLLITGLTASGLKAAAAEWLQQFIFQQFAYDAALRGKGKG